MVQFASPLEFQQQLPTSSRRYRLDGNSTNFLLVPHGASFEEVTIPAGLDMTRCHCMLAPVASTAAGQAADNDAEQRDDAVHDGLAHRSDSVDDRHDDGANSGEDGFDLRTW
jgi:hypothetical protein